MAQRRVKDSKQKVKKRTSIKPGVNGNGRAPAANGKRKDTPSSTAAGRPSPPRKRKVTAESLATKQRDISVSEFFAKNRHLLGFDNPRKALLTTVKEAVDNALDACEEAGILPTIRVEIHASSENRFRVIVDDNGPGIVKAQIPNIFGKLLYGSKFHRLRMSRGQQGIGISAAGMYGMLTTGQPIRITSRTSPRKPAHYYELQIDTNRNRPEVLKDEQVEWEGVKHGTRVEIELEARYQRGRQAVYGYLLQTVIANPHVEITLLDPDGREMRFERASNQLPEEPQEIKPHPYGVELGVLMKMLKQTDERSLKGFLTQSFSRVSGRVADQIVANAENGLTAKSYPTRIAHAEADRLYRAIQVTRISAPSTDCLAPITAELLEQGLRKVVDADFYETTTRTPSVYRGNPFQIEAGIAYGGSTAVAQIDQEQLIELLRETDIRTVRQFLVASFTGVGSQMANEIIAKAGIPPRTSPKWILEKTGPESLFAKLHAALSGVNSDPGQSMTIYRYANRVPLLYQQSACAIHQAITSTNWRAYGLSQSNGSLPSGPVTVVVHMASVWVPFTSESKEAIAAYPEIIKDVKLALQDVGRKLGTYLRGQRKQADLLRKHRYIERYLPHIGIGIRAILGLDETEERKFVEQLQGILERSRN